MVAVANPGCAIQIAAGLREIGSTVRVAHPAELLSPERRGERARAVTLAACLAAGAAVGIGAGAAEAAQVGSGTPASCTSAAVVSAVARGGLVTFDCGPAPVTIRMRQTAKVRNTNPSLVLDGGGRVTLSGGGARRILYQNTCDRAQVWTTDHCQNQATPRLVVRNITLRGRQRDGPDRGRRRRRGDLRPRRAADDRPARASPATAATAPARTSGGAAVRALSQYRNHPGEGRRAAPSPEAAAPTAAR